jgi:hypothetical protein
MVFTASDFPALAGGIEVRTSGDAVAQTWSPASQEWRLSQDGDTVNLWSLEKRGDPLPRWQKLGKVVLRAGHPLKITLSGKKKPETDQDKSKAKPDSKAQTDSKTKDDPPAVPALLVLNTDSQADPERVLDLVRGRVDTAGPSPDRRRTQVRTNQEGAEFQPPSSAQAWRDRAMQLRQQMLVALGLWPMPPKTPLNPRLYGKLQRDGYTIEKVVLETMPGFTLSGNLYRPAGTTGRVPGLLCPHGHQEDGGRSPVE